MTVVKSGALIEHDQAGANEVEGVIREFVQRDSATPRQMPAIDGEVGGDNISVLLQRMAGSSLQQIDRLISDLRIVRERLQNECVRVQGEIADYASLNQAAAQSTRIIGEGLAQWKSVSTSRHAG